MLPVLLVATTPYDGVLYFPYATEKTDGPKDARLHCALAANARFGLAVRRAGLLDFNAIARRIMEETIDDLVRT